MKIPEGWSPEDVMFVLIIVFAFVVFMTLIIAIAIVNPSALS